MGYTLLQFETYRRAAAERRLQDLRTQVRVGALLHGYSGGGKEAASKLTELLKSLDRPID